MAPNTKLPSIHTGGKLVVGGRGLIWQIALSPGTGTQNRFQGTLLVLLQCPIANSITLNSKMNQEASSIVLYIDPAWSLI
jgi:hypothetical protein